MRNSICSQSASKSINRILIASSLMLIINCPALAQGAGNGAQPTNIMQQLGGFMTNLEQQLSGLNQSAQVRQETSPQPTIKRSKTNVSTKARHPIVVKKPVHEPLPTVVQNPLADAQEDGVQENISLNMKALQSAMDTEDRLQAQIAQMQSTARSSAQLTTIKKQLNGEVAIEKQIRANISGWNQYLISYEQYLTDSESSSGSTSDNNSYDAFCGTIVTGSDYPDASTFVDIYPPAPQPYIPDNPPVLVNPAVDLSQ